MIRLRQLAFIGLAIAAAGLGLLAGKHFVPTDRAAPLAPEQGQAGVAQLFEKTLNDAAGQPHPLAQWRGKTLVVNFWASWCPPCRNEMPAFSRQQQAFSDKNVQFVGIALDSSAAVAAFQQQIPSSFPLLIGDPETSSLARMLGNSRMALPYTAIIDRQGTLRHTQAGEMHESELVALLTRIAHD